MVSRGRGRWDEMTEGIQKYKLPVINKSWDGMYSMVTMIDNIVLHI